MTSLLISLLVVGVIWMWARGRSASRGRSITPPSATFTWPPHGEFDYEVVGESFYQKQIGALLKDTPPGEGIKTTAVLWPESDNPHDPMAVSIWIEGGKVGHMSRADARSFRRRLTSKKLGRNATQCEAFVEKGRSAGMDSVWLNIKPFDN